MTSVLFNSAAVFSSKLFQKTRPIIVHFNVTNRCNLNCTFCYNQGITENSRIINALDGISFSINDAFTLGMWPEIAENIKRARRIKETISLSCILTHTNCAKLDHILAFVKTHSIGIYFTLFFFPARGPYKSVQIKLRPTGPFLSF